MVSLLSAELKNFNIKLLERDLKIINLLDVKEAYYVVRQVVGN